MPTLLTAALVPDYQNSVYSDSDGWSGTFAFSRTVFPFHGGNMVKVTTSNPNYRVSIALRQDASSPYFKSWFSYQLTKVTCSTFNKTGNPTYFIYGNNVMYKLGYVPPIFDNTNSDAADIAVARLKRKIQSHVKDMNAVTPVAELRELHQTIEGSIHLTTGLLKALIDIKRTKGLSAFKYASEAWLTWGFGIAPMISDIKKTTESINAYLARKDHTVKLSSSSSAKDSVVRTKDSHSSSGHTGAYGAPYKQFSRWVNSYEYRCSALVYFTLTSANDYSAMQHFGVTPPSLVPAAWELTAFSWVVDYFTTVGEYLDDTFTLTPVNTIYVNQTRKFTIYGATYFKHYPESNDAFISSDSGGESNWSYSEFERTVLPSIPHRIVRIRTADEIAKYSLNKLLNLASVLGVMAKSSSGGKKRKYL